MNKNLVILILCLMAVITLEAQNYSNYVSVSNSAAVSTQLIDVRYEFVQSSANSSLAFLVDKYTGKVEPVESFMEIGMGGMYSTAEETCKFISDITNRNSKILSKNSVDAMGEKEYLKGVWPIDDNDNILFLIEVNGKQHYEPKFSSNPEVSQRILELQQQQDLIHKNLQRKQLLIFMII